MHQKYPNQNYDRKALEVFERKQGRIFLEEIGNIYKKEKWRFTIKTSAPSLIYALKKSYKWNCTQFGRHKGGNSGVIHSSNDKNQTSKHRLTASFEMK